MAFCRTFALLDITLAQTLIPMHSQSVLWPTYLTTAQRCALPPQRVGLSMT